MLYKIRKWQEATPEKYPVKWRLLLSSNAPGDDRENITRIDLSKPKMSRGCGSKKYFVHSFIIWETFTHLRNVVFSAVLLFVSISLPLYDDILEYFSVSVFGSLESPW